MVAVADEAVTAVDTVVDRVAATVEAGDADTVVEEAEVMGAEVEAEVEVEAATEEDAIVGERVRTTSDCFYMRLLPPTVCLSPSALCLLRGLDPQGRFARCLLLASHACPYNVVCGSLGLSVEWLLASMTII